MTRNLTLAMVTTMFAFAAGSLAQEALSGSPTPTVAAANSTPTVAADASTPVVAAPMEVPLAAVPTEVTATVLAGDPSATGEVDQAWLSIKNGIIAILIGAFTLIAIWWQKRKTKPVA